MAKGKYTATSASTVLVAADDYRAHITIQHTNATQVALGIGEAAVAGEGVQLFAAGDSVRIDGALACYAIYMIGNGGTGTYQTGDVTVSCK
jgi:hypothetical protein